MKFVFSKLFYSLLTLGFVPLSLSWGRPGWRWLGVGFDAALLLAAVIDSRLSRLPAGLEITREVEGRFHIGAETLVRVRVANHTAREFRLQIKDEYPPELCRYHAMSVMRIPTANALPKLMAPPPTFSRYDRMPNGTSRRETTIVV